MLNGRGRGRLAQWRGCAGRSGLFGPPDTQLVADFEALLVGRTDACHARVPSEIKTHLALGRPRVVGVRPDTPGGFAMSSSYSDHVRLDSEMTVSLAKMSIGARCITIQSHATMDPSRPGDRVRYESGFPRRNPECRSTCRGSTS